MAGKARRTAVEGRKRRPLRELGHLEKGAIVTDLQIALLHLSQFTL